MKQSPAPVWLLLCLCLMAVSISGCNVLYRDPVRHLSSDICLVTPNMTRQEVANALGMPDEKRPIEGGEEWIYHEVRKSVLRRTPWIGSRLGSEEFDLITITFVGDRVQTCAYRNFSNAEELKKSGVDVGEPLGE